MTSPSPVLCAIDRPDLDGALALSRLLKGAIGGLKLGLEFVTANGPEGVRRISELGLPVFLDVKFHDIPNTVKGAVRAAASLGVHMLTLHTAGGPAMLRAASEAIREFEQPPLLLGVTVMTSMDRGDLERIGIAASPAEQVLCLADLAHETGLDGVICSAMEIKPLRERFGPDLKLVVPGIRPAGADLGDQKRTLSPAEAILAGADHLVVGRPITRAVEPRSAALAIAADIQTAREAS